MKKVYIAGVVFIGGVLLLDGGIIGKDASGILGSIGIILGIAGLYVLIREYKKESADTDDAVKDENQDRSDN